MRRLTKKEGINIVPNVSMPTTNDWVDCCLDRLSKYEDLEEKGVSVKILLETVERNLIAWDTSKGQLPEVYLHNKSVYEKLIGEEYSFIKVKKKYCD